MKKKFIIFSLLLPFICKAPPTDPYDKLKDAIVHSNHAQVKKLLENNSNDSIFKTMVKGNNKTLVDLAQQTHDMRATQVNHGQQKEWNGNGKRVIIGILCMLGGVVKGSLDIYIPFEKDVENDPSKIPTLIPPLVTDASLLAVGFYELYCGLSGKTPSMKLEEAYKIVQLIQSNNISGLVTALDDDLEQGNSTPKTERSYLITKNNQRL